MSKFASLVASSSVVIALGVRAEWATADPPPSASAAKAWLAATLLEGPFKLTASGSTSVVGTTFADGARKMGMPVKTATARASVEMNGAFTLTHNNRSNPAVVGSLVYIGHIDGIATGEGTTFQAANGLPPETPTIPCSGVFKGSMTLEIKFKDYNAKRVPPTLVVDYSATVDCGGGVTLGVVGANRLDASMHSAVVPAPGKPGAFRAPFPVYSQITMSTATGGDMVLGDGTLMLGGLIYGETPLDVAPMAYPGRSVEPHVFFFDDSNPLHVLPHANFAGEVWVDGANQVTIDPGPPRTGKSQGQQGHVSSEYRILREVRSWTKDTIPQDGKPGAPAPSWGPDGGHIDPVQDWVDCPGVTFFAGPPATWGTRNQSVMDEFLVRVDEHPEFGTVYIAFAMELRKNAYRIRYSELQHITEQQYEEIKVRRTPFVAYPLAEAAGGWVNVSDVK